MPLPKISRDLYIKLTISTGIPCQASGPLSERVRSKAQHRCPYHGRANEICRPPDARQTPQMQRPHRRIAKKQAGLRFSQKSQPATPAAAWLAVCRSAAVAAVVAARVAATIAVFRFTIAVFQDSLAGQSQNRHFSAQKA